MVEPNETSALFKVEPKLNAAPMHANLRGQLIRQLLSSLLLKRLICGVEQ